MTKSRKYRTAAEALAHLLSPENLAIKTAGEASASGIRERSPAPSARQTAGGSTGPSPWKTRLQTVAKAIETDPACTGRASAALAILSNRSLDSLSAGAVIKAVRLAEPSADLAAEARCSATLSLLAEGAAPTVAVQAANAVPIRQALVPAKAFRAAPQMAQAAASPVTPMAPLADANHSWGAIHAEMRERTGRAALLSAPAADTKNHGWGAIHADTRERRA